MSPPSDPNRCAISAQSHLTHARGSTTQVEEFQHQPFNYLICAGVARRNRIAGLLGPYEVIREFRDTGCQEIVMPEPLTLAIGT